jgi:predicted MFS family arabinose efflux permease
MKVIIFSWLFVQIGIWVRNFAVLLFIVDKTSGDPLAVSMISVAQFAPIFVFSFIGGTFADRWRPKRTMIWCDLLSALSVFAVLITIIFADWKAIFLATLFSAILSQFSQPCGMKLFKIYLPEELIQVGMSSYQMIAAVFTTLGPMMGTFVYQHFGINIAIAIMGIAFLLSAGALLFLPSDRRPEEVKPTNVFRQEMLNGFKYVLSKKTLTILGTCLIGIGLGSGLIQPLAVFLVTERLGLAKEYLQWLFVANGVGAILGGTLAMSSGKSLAPQKMLVLGMLVNAVAVSVYGWSTILWLTLPICFCLGLAFPCIQIGINTLIIQNTEAAFIGRVSGNITPLFIGAMVIMMSISGLLKRIVPLVLIYQVSALFFLGGLIIILPIYFQTKKSKQIANTSPETPGTV